MKSSPCLHEVMDHFDAVKLAAVQFAAVQACACANHELMISLYSGPPSTGKNGSQLARMGTRLLSSQASCESITPVNAREIVGGAAPAPRRVHHDSRPCRELSGQHDVVSCGGRVFEVASRCTQRPMHVRPIGEVHAAVGHIAGLRADPSLAATAVVYGCVRI